MNNLNFLKIDKKRFPVVDIIKLLPENDSLFETILVSANDTLVKLFLDDKIKFTDISKLLIKITKLKEFKKYKSIRPKNLVEINNLVNYVSLKVNSLSV